MSGGIMEKRNDIGLKLVYVILTAMLTLLLSVFFNKTYNIACEASERGYSNEKNIAVLQQSYKEIDRRLCGIDTKLDTLIAK